MKRISSRRFNSLWSHAGKSLVKTASGNSEVYLKKSMDEICFRADLAESTLEYSQELCEGVVHLYEMQVSPALIKSHSVLVQKIMRLGQDILENSDPASDLFSLGAFIEVKMNSAWRDIAFFQFILKAIAKLKKFGQCFTQKIKLKIWRKLQQNHASIYKKYEPFLELVFFGESDPKALNSA